MKFMYIFGTIAFTVVGQLLSKWRMTHYEGKVPQEFIQKFVFLGSLFLDPYILGAYLMAFLASLFWLLALSKFSLGFAYPFMGLSFVMIAFLSTFLLGESMNPTKIIGNILIVAGIVVVGLGYQSQ
ncbi:MAG: EamA family transporter [Bdellovibrionota bacterium]